MPCLLNFFEGERPRHSRFYGSLDAQRHPNILLALLSHVLANSPEDLVVQLFAYRPTPVLRQTVLLAAEMMQPDRILIAAGTELDQGGFPVGPEEVELEKALPNMVQHAQRKAQWLKLFESCERHVVDLRKVTIEGARLGSGRMLSTEERKSAGLERAVHVEALGSSLFVISDAELEDSEIAKALDFTGCAKAVFTEPGIYRNLLCSFARQNGEDFGFGIVTDIDWRFMRAQILSTAVPPAPVRILRLGSFRVDSDGRELGETRPWQV